MPDANLVLNLVTLLAVAVVTVPVLRSKRKDGVITEQSLVIESHEKRISVLEKDLAGAQKRADESMVHASALETRAAAAEARYEEVQKYTAQPAVENFERILLEHQRAVQERHALMIESLQQVTAALDEVRAGLRSDSSPPS